ncbi:hypothetical protein MtrunA17_Chr2g0308171 [Medicago truncatula]|uniref:Ubiquitin-like domain-containing protein n=1 Tax=Medicago truncatula TaxID=3880 RepID=A0A396JAB6_MEDTR|nr:hypothetical protein MtrunA17_Chr2g0308171 [Medicago truncatula]
MAEDSNEKEIQIRTLTGESITLHITRSSTVQQLKLLLNHSFPPATNSPNFHLFFKALSLSLSLSLNFHCVFIVIVLFSSSISRVCNL